MGEWICRWSVPPIRGDQATSGDHEATGLSAAAGVGSSCHSPVLLQQRNPISDSPGMAFGGVALVAVLNKMATALHKSKWLLLRRSQNGYELVVELSEPLVLFLQSLSTPPAFGYSRCSIA